MKIITKSKLPRWATFIFPFKEEEYVLRSAIIPFLFILLVGIWIFVYELFRPSLDLVKILISLSFLGVFVAIVWWLLVQTDILYALRERLKLHYQITKDEEERLRTKKRLKSLFMKV